MNYKRKPHVYRKPHRYWKKKPILRGRFLALGFLALLIASAIFYFLFLFETFWIEKIIVSGEKKVMKEEIELLVERRLKNKVLFFETKSIFALNTRQIKRDILDFFPQIAEVKVSRGFFDAVSVEVTEREALALWCQEERCFLIDLEGVIFEEVSPEMELFKIGSWQIIDSLALGLTVVTKEKLGQIFEVKSGLAETVKLSITESFLASEERLNVKTSEGWEIYFNLKGDLQWQVKELDLLLEKQISPEKREELEYVELRFNRVYYK